MELPVLRFLPCQNVRLRFSERRSFRRHQAAAGPNFGFNLTFSLSPLFSEVVLAKARIIMGGFSDVSKNQ
jgi:hypothetical protein